jgi:hypothetical protein
MIAWENKPPHSKPGRISRIASWKKPLEQRQYLQATTKHLRFKDAALTAKELAEAEEEGETTAMMFALLQDQHEAQLKAMVAANKQAMDAILECTNALIAGQSKAADKATATTRPSIRHHKLQEESMCELRKACLSQTTNLL